MNTYFWNINEMDRLTADGFVVTVHYTVTACANVGNYMASTYGTVSYTQQQDANFTPYDQLTKEQVIGWVQTTLGKDTVEASLAAQIELLKNPVTATGTPW
jgi:hypothetical protein